MIKSVPLRKCIVTNERLTKEELFRVVKTPTNEIKIDDTYALYGRGAYIKKDKDIILKAMRKHLFDRALKAKIEDAIYNELIAKLEGGIYGKESKK